MTIANPARENGRVAGAVSPVLGSFVSDVVVEEELELVLVVELAFDPETLVVVFASTVVDFLVDDAATVSSHWALSVMLLVMGVFWKSKSVAATLPSLPTRRQPLKV